MAKDHLIVEYEQGAWRLVWYLADEGDLGAFLKPTRSDPA